MWEHARSSVIIIIIVKADSLTLRMTQKHTLIQDEQDLTYIELEYTGGTECDLTGEHRATTVQFICGEGADQFLSIKEDRSCHYKAIISTPRLCRHPSFRKQIPTFHKIKCEPRAMTE